MVQGTTRYLGMLALNSHPHPSYFITTAPAVINIAEAPVRKFREKCEKRCLVHG
jgi:hypothetical protein